MSALAYEHNGRPVDAARFYEIACDPRRWNASIAACIACRAARIVAPGTDGRMPRE